ncbi:MAG: hypothetical protein GEEBNDBF_01478 [bacterium]|nr:hypothetical protein [bacterium]
MRWLIVLALLVLATPFILFAVLAKNPELAGRLEQQVSDAEFRVKEEYYERIAARLRSNPAEARLPLGSELAGQLSTQVVGAQLLLQEPPATTPDILLASPVLFYWPLLASGDPRPLLPLPPRAAISPAEVVYYGQLPPQASGQPLQTDPPFTLHAPLPDYYKEADPDLLAGPHAEQLAVLTRPYKRFVGQALLLPLEQLSNSLASIGQIPASFGEFQTMASFALVQEPLAPVMDVVPGIEAFIDRSQPDAPRVTVVLQQDTRLVDSLGVPFHAVAPWQPLWTLAWDDPSLRWISRDTIPVQR